MLRSRSAHLFHVEQILLSTAGELVADEVLAGDETNLALDDCFYPILARLIED